MDIQCVLQGIQSVLTEHLPEAQADCQSFEAQLVSVPGAAANDPFYNGTPILIQAAGSLLATVRPQPRETSPQRSV